MNILHKFFALAAFSCIICSCADKSDSIYLIPIDESSSEVVLSIQKGQAVEYVADIRLALGDKVDYYVPLDLSHFDAKPSDVAFKGVSSEDAWKVIKPSDGEYVVPEDKYRPLYHHTPEYGWMNDANGLFFKDGVYHLYYQYNPFASVWGNMHWGHSTSTDLIHWEHQPVALYRDDYGHIFSGSSVVDYKNTAGFGEGAVVSFYTSWNLQREYIQTQCIAYSTDNGQTFTKYDSNPVLVPFDGIADFRDPKVFWYEPQSKWIMIVSADTQMRFYTSQDLKNWEFMSGWGDGYGVQPRQFECPDFFELTTSEGDKKWVMIVNVNPGCFFGGSATQYFVGDFDGTTFTCDSPKETVKWLDWGKDHYATVTFFGTEDRVVAVPWMSNWQYGAIVPTRYFRSANAIARELSLYKDGKEYYVSVNPVKELSVLEKESTPIAGLSINGPAAELPYDNDGAYELDASIESLSKGTSCIRLSNVEGEYVDLYFDAKEGRFVMDRTKSGIVDFGENSTTHQIENHDRRKTNAINYVNDFALATWAPVEISGRHSLKLLLDKSSIEAFVDGGKIAMTNLVFPASPYNKIELISSDDKFKVESVSITKLEY